jgi:hypothetical protein
VRPVFPRRGARVLWAQQQQLYTRSLETGGVASICRHRGWTGGSFPGCGPCRQPFDDLRPLSTCNRKGAGGAGRLGAMGWPELLGGRWLQTPTSQRGLSAPRIILNPVDRLPRQPGLGCDPGDPHGLLGQQGAGKFNAPPDSYGVHWCVFRLGRHLSASLSRAWRRLTHRFLVSPHICVACAIMRPCPVPVSSAVSVPVVTRGVGVSVVWRSIAVISVPVIPVHVIRIAVG